MHKEQWDGIGFRQCVLRKNEGGKSKKKAVGLWNKNTIFTKFPFCISRDFLSFKT
jgi:hypothetical protein